MNQSMATIFQDINLEGNLIPYLQLIGWKAAPDTNAKWFIYQGGKDSEGEPLEIVLPRNPHASDFGLYLENSVNLLAGLNNEDLHLTVRRIVLYDYDVLYTRNIETGERNSIALRLAAKQVNRLRNIVAYSACSEHEPKPYFLSGQISTAQRMVEHYRFGHTFAGSFGFTVESQIIREPKPYYQTRLFSEKSDRDPALLVMPLERRVMERIARGLHITQQATQNLNSQLLIDEYASGFNSNMCKAIIDISETKKAPIEYSVVWSPKFKPANEIFALKPVRLNERSYEYLEYAAEKLRELKPEYVTIKGKVIGLSSKENPLGTAPTDRSVIIKGKFQEQKRSVDVLVELEKEDYIIANQAHIKWDTVEVSGIISRTGNAWRLSEPKGFRVIG